jgi:hypothetical protein
MPGTVTLNGEIGRVERGYHVAAVLAPYTLIRDGNDWTLTGKVQTANAFHLAQAGLVFIAPHHTQNGARGEWRWPITVIHYAGGRITARLGPPLS